jgi:hypothetical protein
VHARGNLEICMGARRVRGAVVSRHYSVISHVARVNYGVDAGAYVGKLCM